MPREGEGEDEVSFLQEQPPMRHLSRSNLAGRNRERKIRTLLNQLQCLVCGGAPSTCTGLLKEVAAKSELPKRVLRE